jgi:7-carboxy-7-deazaguanine synthase
VSGETSYSVNAIYDTIQGEGVLAGQPAMLIRLQGCKVGCSFCDTKQSWDPHHPAATSMTANEIASHCKSEMAKKGIKPKWAIITGGEPTEQNLGPLLMAVALTSLSTVVETAGTEEWTDELACATLICVSPKWSFVLPTDSMMEHAHEIKQVVCKPSDIEPLLHWLATHPQRPVISLQPVAGSERALQWCIEECKRRGWRLSVQLHKIIGVE